MYAAAASSCSKYFLFFFPFSQRSAPPLTFFDEIFSSYGFRLTTISLNFHTDLDEKLICVWNRAMLYPLERGVYLKRFSMPTNFFSSLDLKNTASFVAKKLLPLFFLVFFKCLSYRIYSFVVASLTFYFINYA